MSGHISQVILNDGRVMKVFEPNADRDLDRLVSFLSGLPQHERNNMRYNVTDKTYGRKRLEMVDKIDHWRLLAEVDGKIVGDATMDRSLYRWTRHVADIRCAVDVTYEEQGVRAVLLRALVEAGAATGIERLCSEVLDSQPGLKKSLQDLGFSSEVVRKHYAKDLEGAYHDVIIMSNDREPVWRRLSETLEEMDIRLDRMYGGE